MKKTLLALIIVLFSSVSFAQKCCRSICDDNISLWTAADLMKESKELIWVKIQQYYDYAENKLTSKEDRYYYYTKVIEYTEKLCNEHFNKYDPQIIYQNALLGKYNTSMELRKPCEEVISNYNYAIKKGVDATPSLVESYEIVKRGCR